jgi:hypothetical protein
MYKRTLLIILFCLGLIILFSQPNEGTAQAPDPTATPEWVKPMRGNEEILVAPGAVSSGNFSAIPSFGAGIDDWTNIAFQSYRDGDYDIYFAGGDGSSAVNLTADPASDARPSLNRGATRIAFNSNRWDNNHEIYAINTDGSGLTRLTYNASADYGAVWSPDGS